MAREQESNVTAMMQMMLKMRAEDRKAEQRWVEREEARREEDLRREERMLLALRAAQPAVPQTVTIQNHKLPEMREGEEVETFIAMFKAALRTNKIPQAQWKPKLHSHLTLKTKIRIQSTIQDCDSTYEEVKEALLGCSNMTFSAAAKTLMSGDGEKQYNLDHRQCRDKLMRLAKKVTKTATSQHETLQCIVVAFMRHNLVPSLKNILT